MKRDLTRSDPHLGLENGLERSWARLCRVLTAKRGFDNFVCLILSLDLYIR